MSVLFGCFFGFIAWFIVRYILAGLYTVNQNERAVKTIFGRAERIKGATTLEDPIAEYLRPEERERYRYPQVRVIQPGGPYFTWPWEKIYKVSVATQTAIASATAVAAARLITARTSLAPPPRFAGTASASPAWSMRASGRWVARLGMRARASITSVARPTRLTTR